MPTNMRIFRSARGRRALATLLGVAAATVPVAGGLVGTPAVAGTTTTITTGADAMVNKAYPNSNFGTKATLRADATPVVRSYVRFNLTNVAGPIAKATVRVYSKASGSGFRVYGAGSSWTEGKINWANAPALGAAGNSSGPVTSGTWAAVDVTALVTAGTASTLVLTQAGTSDLRFNSREAASRKPQLVVETAGTTSPPVEETTTTTAAPSTTTTTAPATSPPLSGDRCAPAMTARQAQYNLLGYLFSDGHLSGGTFNYRTASTCTATRVKTVIKTLGLQATVTTGDTGTKFAIKAVAPFDHYWTDGVPEPTAPGVATSDDLAWFLAGTLEGEGSTGGKVLDDPYWGRTAGIVGLYSRMNVVVKPDRPAPTCGCSSDPNYWNTYVDPQADRATYNGYIDIIRSWPMAVMGRVPNYK